MHCMTMVVEDLRQHTIESVVRSHHVYKEIWQRFVEQRLICIKRRPMHAHNKCAVSLVKDGIVVGRELSQTFWHFIAQGGTMILMLKLSN